MKRNRRYFWLNGIIVLFIVAGIVFWSASLRVGGDIFNPATCLGTWQNPSAAQGKPETLDGSAIFSTENSSLFTDPAAKIFCGNFIAPEYEPTGDVQSLALTLVWHFGEPPAPAPSGTSTLLFIPIAYAQESPESPPAETPPAEEPPIQEPPAQEPPPQEEPPITEIQEELLNFIKLSYSVDAENWFELAQVNETNWPHLTVGIPLKTWDELRNLQIALEGIEGFSGQRPKVYLDGMFVEIHYAPPVVVEAQDLISSISEIILPANTIEILPPQTLESPAEAQNSGFIFAGCQEFSDVKYEAGLNFYVYSEKDLLNAHTDLGGKELKPGTPIGWGYDPVGNPHCLLDIRTSGRFHLLEVDDLEREVCADSMPYEGCKAKARREVLFEVPAN